MSIEVGRPSKHEYLLPSVTPLIITTPTTMVDFDSRSIRMDQIRPQPPSVFRRVWIQPQLRPVSM